MASVIMLALSDLLPITAEMKIIFHLHSNYKSVALKRQSGRYVENRSWSKVNSINWAVSCQPLSASQPLAHRKW